MVGVVILKQSKPGQVPSIRDPKTQNRVSVGQAKKEEEA